MKNRSRVILTLALAVLVVGGCRRSVTPDSAKARLAERGIAVEPKSLFAAAAGKFRDPIDEGDPEATELLLIAGVPHSSKDEKGNTPLHIAALWGHEEVARILLLRGADPNAKDASGDTPLAKGCIGGPEMVKLLLANKADPNVRDSVGSTPFSSCAAHQTADALALMIEHGADATTRDRFGRTPLFWAFNGHPAGEAREEIRMLLAKHGCTTDVVK